MLNIALGGLVRLGAAWMFGQEWFQNRPELGTPITAYRNIRECAALSEAGLNPYDGDQCHELPMVAWFLGLLMRHRMLFGFYVIKCFSYSALRFGNNG